MSTNRYYSEQPSMDILLVGIEEYVQIHPASIHGMLWLQTHFEDSEWEVIASNQARILKEESQSLKNDAFEAGLTVNSLPELSIAVNFKNIH